VFDASSNRVHGRQIRQDRPAACDVLHLSQPDVWESDELAAYRYDPYGQTCGVWSATSGTIAIPWRFQGRILETSATGTGTFQGGVKMEVSTLSGNADGVSPQRWTFARRTFVLLWAIAVVLVTWASYHWLVGQKNLSDDIGREGIAALVVGFPLVAGLLAGIALRGARWQDLIVVAILGAGCLAATLYVAWVSDPSACQPTAGTDCDTGFSLGATVIAGICLIPFGSGALAGSGAARLLRRRSAGVPESPGTSRHR
jgi:hypothetical protein